MVGVGAWVLSAVLLYAGVLVKLVQQWGTDPTYSHGVLVPPIALFLVYRQRDRLRQAARRPSIFGFVLIAFSLALYLLGSLGAELFVTRASLIGVLAGTVLYVFGWNHLRLVAFGGHQFKGVPSGSRP